MVCNDSNSFLLTGLAIDAALISALLITNDDWNFGSLIFGVAALNVVYFAVYIRRSLGTVAGNIWSRGKSISRLTEEFGRFGYPRDIQAMDWESYASQIIENPASDEAVVRDAIAVRGVIKGMRLVNRPAVMVAQSAIDAAVRRYLS